MRKQEHNDDDDDAAAAVSDLTLISSCFDGGKVNRHTIIEESQSTVMLSRMGGPNS